MGEIQDKEKLAELCGTIIGDGWIQSDKRCFFLAGDPTEDKDYIDNRITKLTSDLIHPTKPKDFPYWRVYGISIYNKEAIQKLISLGLPIGRKIKSAKVPKWILDSDIKVKSAYIRGFFDTDGGIFCQKDYTKYAKEFDTKHHTKLRLRISNTCQRLMDQTFNLFKELGFRCTKRTIKGGFRHNRNNNNLHIIEINSFESLANFFTEIKPSNPKHLTKYLIWKKFGFCPPHTTINQRKDILKNRLNPYNLYKQE